LPAARELLNLRHMRRMLIVALCSSGCMLAGHAINDPGVSPIPPGEDAHVETLMRRSLEAAPCPARVERSGRLEWRVESCRGTQLCWATSEDDYACD